MGTVTSATVIRDNGVTDHYAGLDQAVAHAEGGLIECHYAYGPALLPPQTPSTDGMWRYRALLPIADGPILYPLMVGSTPLLASPRLRQVTGVADLWLKDETRTPTGSNKDRATALVLETALRQGVRTVSCASTGNVAVSLAVGAAAAGIEAIIFVPAAVADAKLRLMLLAGATVLKIEEGYGAAFALSRQAARAFGWYDRNTGVNPLTVEAKKTVALEIWEQLGRRAPDAILVPVGDGPTLTAMTKGFRDLIACGAIDRLPRIVGVQAEGCQPLKSAWQYDEPVRPAHADTIADGIAVDLPISAVTVLRDVRESGGGFVAVSDDALLRAIGTLAHAGGIIAEPAGAAAFAGLEPALAGGLIARDERVIVHVTGTGLKTPQFMPLQGTAPQIRAQLAEVEWVLKQRTRGR